MNGWIQDFMISVASMAAVVFVAQILDMLFGIPRGNFATCAVLVLVFMVLFRMRRRG